MTRILDRIDRPQDLHELSEEELAAGRPGGARAHHRHGRGDRRALRRQPRHVRARGRAAFAAGLAEGQDPLGRRPSGLPPQGPDRPARPAADDPPVRGPRAVLLDPGVRARHHGRRPRLDLDRLRGRAQGGHAPASGDERRRQGRRGHRRRRDDRRRRVRGDPPGRRPGHADRRRPQRQRHVDLAERRRAVALLQPRPAEPEALARPRGRRAAADGAAGGHRRRVRAASARS